jgi:hypothetical protein
MEKVFYVAGVGAFIIGVLVYLDFNFNDAKITTYLARKFF